MKERTQDGEEKKKRRMKDWRYTWMDGVKVTREQNIEELKVLERRVTVSVVKARLID